MEKCKECGRSSYRLPCFSCSKKRITSGYVVHDYYGCDTGCCGHSIKFLDAEGRRVMSEFKFDHPYGEKEEEFASRLFKQECAYEGLRDVKLDFALCEIRDD